jgi:hypothetical protein
MTDIQRFDIPASAKNIDTYRAFRSYLEKVAESQGQEARSAVVRRQPGGEAEGVVNGDQRRVADRNRPCFPSPESLGPRLAIGHVEIPGSASTDIAARWPPRPVPSPIPGAFGGLA